VARLAGEKETQESGVGERGGWGSGVEPAGASLSVGFGDDVEDSGRTTRRDAEERNR
jgi:hypothetical protein